MRDNLPRSLAARAALGFALALAFAAWSCAGASAPETYGLSYAINGGSVDPASSLAVPADAGAYASGGSAAVKGCGPWYAEGKGFVGWNTKADGSGAAYGEGDALSFGAADLVLYAQWRGASELGLSFSAFTDADGSSGYSVKASDTAIASAAIPSKYGKLPVLGLGSMAFYDCAELASVDIPSSVTTIGSYAFDGAASLAACWIPESVTDFDPDYAFCFCSALASVRLPASLKSIGNSMFLQCSKLASVDIPSGVTAIDTSAFSSCSALASVELPAGLESLGAWAFSGCSKLAAVSLPAAVTSIGGQAFSGASALSSIEVLVATPPAIGSNAFEGGAAAIRVPAASLEAYKAASGWSAYASRLAAIEVR